MIEPEKLELRSATELVVTWPDGRVDTLSAATLRDACACAACRNAPTPLAPADPATCEIMSIGLVGAYAVNIVFAPDGHGTGIYPYGLLRSIGDDAS
ncbi:MAG: gamma-butyrobetaine hydroxylase-like domain-containing protein [Acidimicrobiia bacterium]